MLDDRSWWGNQKGFYLLYLQNKQNGGREMIRSENVNQNESQRKDVGFEGRAGIKNRHQKTGRGGGEGSRIDG